MQVYESITAAHLSGPTHLTIGSYDGVHRGHRAIIHAMRQAARAQGASCGLLTFHPHPRAVLLPQKPMASINSLSERLKLYAQTGLDFSIVHPFTHQTAQTSAQDFMALLQKHLGLTDLWVGPDFALGQARQGDISFLQAYGQKTGIQIHITPEFRWEGVPVRSSRIRQAIQQGSIEWANTWLGRLFTLSGVIVYGDQRGRTLGFPTANIAISQNRAHLANGVYAAWADVQGERHPAVVNIGVRPTVDGRTRTIEAHLIDFDANIYGRCLTLSFVARLRDEMKFPGLDALKAQIARDKTLGHWLLQQALPITSYQRFVPADDGLHCFGASREQLFAHAGLALAGSEMSANAAGATAQHYIEAVGEDEGSLIANWLHEIAQQIQNNALPQMIVVQEMTHHLIRARVFTRTASQSPATLPPLPPHLPISPPATDNGLWEVVI
jgi:riboflavin kinase/FMN adenylyltransferase